MPDRFEYLASLEAEARRRLPASEAEAIVAEARDHLEESIQARLELGMAPEEAARESVAAFGAARRLAQIAAEGTASARARMRWLAAYGWLFVPTILWSALAARSMPDLLVQANVLAFCAVAIGFGLAAFRSGRPSPLAVLRRSVVALGVGAALLLATHVVYESEGYPSFVGRTRVADRMASYESEAEMALKGRLRDSASRSGPELATQYRRFADELRSAADHPLANVLPTLHLTAILGLRLAAPPLIFDLAFGGLGALGFAVRRRARKGPLGA